MRGRVHRRQVRDRYERPGNTVPVGEIHLYVFAFALTNQQDKHIERVCIDESLSLISKDLGAV